MIGLNFRAHSIRAIPNAKALDVKRDKERKMLWRGGGGGGRITTNSIHSVKERWVRRLKKFCLVCWSQLHWGEKTRDDSG